MMQQPAQCMASIYAWLGLSPFMIDPENLGTTPHESDSHYRMKYSHKQASRIVKPQTHVLPPRIEEQIGRAYSWYYQLYYPNHIPVTP